MKNHIVNLSTIVVHLFITIFAIMQFTQYARAYTSLDIRTDSLGTFKTFDFLASTTAPTTSILSLNTTYTSSPVATFSYVIGSAPLQNPTITISGTPEVLFTFSHTTGCAPSGVPDNSDSRAYAFRRDDGKVALFVSNLSNFSFVGDTLDTVTRDDCRKVFVSPKRSSNAGDFHGSMWLKGAIETPQGDIIGFIHNEYHGELYYPNVCNRLRIPLDNVCWYASSLIAISHDGGTTFDSSTKVLATMPFKFETGQGRIGYNSPYPLSHREGDVNNYMYVLFGAVDNNKVSDLTKSGKKNGTCIMRGRSTELSEWRMWGGTDFDVTVANPYTITVTDPDAHKCEPVLPFLIGAVKYVSSQKVYVALGGISGKVVYAISRDLITWTEPKTLTTFVGHGTWKEGDPAPTAYFSLLDPTSPTRSFETIEGRPYMYYVDFLGEVTGEKGKRRLLRVPLKIDFR